MMNVRSIDINCDLGESPGIEGRRQDEALMPSVSSISIACGAHAGDEATMRRTIIAAQSHALAIGAHPGFPDRAGMGRRRVALASIEIESLVVNQIELLFRIAAEEGVRLAHVKPHGALYNLAADSIEVAEAICRAVRHVDATLTLYGLAGSQLLIAGESAGLRTASEVFADRNYQANGRLVPRDAPDAIAADSPFAIRRVMRILRRGLVDAVDGSLITVRADTICIHGDRAEALSLARGLKSKLLASGFEIAAPGRNG